MQSVLSSLIIFIVPQDVLSEKNNASRFTRLKDFFLVLGQPGDPSESVGLMYTVMHLWKFFYGTAMVTPTPRMVATAAFFLRAGIFQCGVRILERCSDKTVPAHRLQPTCALSLPGANLRRHSSTVRPE